MGKGQGDKTWQAGWLAGRLVCFLAGYTLTGDLDNAKGQLSLTEFLGFGLGTSVYGTRLSVWAIVSILFDS